MKKHIILTLIGTALFQFSQAQWLSSNTISIKSVLKARNIEELNCVISEGRIVHSYEITIQRDGVIQVELFNKDLPFTPPVQISLQRVRVGDEIILKEIISTEVKTSRWFKQSELKITVIE